MTNDPVVFEDWTRVNDALQAYADAIDHGDIPGIVALFAPDGVWEYTPGKLHEGRETIARFFGERMGTFRHTSHNVGPPVVRRGPEPGQFRSTAYFQAKHRLDDDSLYCVWGRYVDELAMVDGQMLITRRAVVAHVTEGTSRSYTMLERVSPP